MRGEEYAGWQACDRGASRVQERWLDCRLGALGTREGRTSNICFILLTLEVSKLSGWLNADAPCGGSKGGASGEGRGMQNSQAVGCASRVQETGIEQIGGYRYTGRSARPTCRACP